MFGYSVKHGKYFILIPCREFRNVLPIQIQNPPFYRVGCGKIPPVEIRKNRLRHTADKHIPTEIIQNFSVNRLTERGQRLKAPPYKRICRFVPERPKKLFKIKREHFEMFLFRGNYNILHVLFKTNQRACFNIIVTSVRNKIFYQLTSFRKLLNLIKDNKRFSFIKSCRIKRRKFCEKHIKVCAVVFKNIKNALRCISEINYDMAFILFPCKFFNNKTFSYAAGAVYHNCGLAV